MNRQNLIEIFNNHAPRTPLTEEEMMIMLNLMMSNDKNLSTDIEIMDEESEIYQHFKPLIESFQGQVFLKRIKYFTTLKISLGAFAMLLQHMPTPGACVMYAFYLDTKLPKDCLVTVEIIAEIFPLGFFTETQLSDIWSAQKVNSEECKSYRCVGAPDNMIDYLEIWKNPCVTVEK